MEYDRYCIKLTYPSLLLPFPPRALHSEEMGKGRSRMEREIGSKSLYYTSPAFIMRVSSYALLRPLRSCFLLRKEGGGEIRLTYYKLNYTK